MLINGKNYVLPELNFNAIVRLEDLGIEIAKLQEKPLSVVRGFVALAMNAPLDKAGLELEEYIVNGGNIEVIVEEITKALQNSGFFQRLAKRT